MPTHAERSVLGVSWIGVCCALVAVDLITKSVAHRFPDLPLVDPLVNSELMLGIGHLPVGLLILVSSTVVLAGASGAQRLVSSGHLRWWVVPLGVAGFGGNVADRVALGHVRDWFVIGSTRWNIADLYLLVAIPMVVAAGITSVRSGQPDRTNEYREEVKQR